MSIPIVLIAGLLFFGAWKWGKAKLSALFVGAIFGMALMTTALGPSVWHGLNLLTKTVLGWVNNVV